MKKWLRRIRGAAGMGLTWALGWAVAGVLIGAASILVPGLPFWDSFFEIFDAPLPAMAMPGFFAGAFFSVVLGIAGRRRRFAELSLPLFGALGGGGWRWVAVVSQQAIHSGASFWLSRHRSIATCCNVLLTEHEAEHPSKENKRARRFVAPAGPLSSI